MTFRKRIKISGNWIIYANYKNGKVTTVELEYYSIKPDEIPSVQLETTYYLEELGDVDGIPQVVPNDVLLKCKELFS